MGADKAGVLLGGRPLSAWVADALGPVCGQVFLVGSGSDRGLDPQSGLMCIPDAHPARCSLTGLYTALLASPTPWTLVVACDYPFVDPDLFRRLLAVPRSGLLGLVPQGPEGAHPLVAIYHRDLLPQMKASLDAGRFRIARAIQGPRTAWFPWASLKRLGVSAHRFWNLNTPQELQKAQNFLEENHGAEDQDRRADGQ